MVTTILGYHTYIHIFILSDKLPPSFVCLNTSKIQYERRPSPVAIAVHSEINRKGVV
jgi:hypothetical protein